MLVFQRLGRRVADRGCHPVTKHEWEANRAKIFAAAWLGRLLEGLGGFRYGLGARSVPISSVSSEAMRPPIS